MSLLQPWYLWALAGLAVPLAIHLLSRKEGPTIRMGSLRHIRETSSRQFRSIRLNEYLLLALRSMVIVLVVLLMSGWYLDSLKDDRKLLILEYGVQSRADLLPVRDSLRSAGFEERFLLPGFPSVSMDKGADAVPEYPTLLEELKQHDVDYAVIIATNRVSGFIGERVTLPDNVRWVTVEGSERAFEVHRMRMQNDSVFVRVGRSSGGETAFISQPIRNAIDSGRKVVERDTIRIALMADRAFDVDKRIMMAAMQAIRSQIPEVIEVSSVAPSVNGYEGFDWLIWLSESPPPRRAGNLLYFGEHGGQPILMDEKQGQVVLTSRLNSEVAVTRHLAVELMQRLVPSKEAWAMARMNDMRSVDDKQAWAKSNSDARDIIIQRGNKASTQYLIIALLVFMLLERVVSYQRNQ